MNIFFRLLKRFVEGMFVVQVDPWTREVGKKRIAIFTAAVVVIAAGIIFNIVAKPLETLQAGQNDKKRIENLEKLKLALVNFQKDTGNLPQVPSGVRFLAGGIGSPAAPGNNWFGVDLSKYLATVPVDPKFSQDSTAPYPFRYTADGILFKLDAYLETNSGNLMQQDGGVLRSRYEVGTGLSLKF